MWVAYIDTILETPDTLTAVLDRSALGDTNQWVPTAGMVFAICLPPLKSACAFAQCIEVHHPEGLVLAKVCGSKELYGEDGLRVLIPPHWCGPVRKPGGGSKVRHARHINLPSGGLDCMADTPEADEELQTLTCVHLRAACFARFVPATQSAQPPRRPPVAHGQLHSTTYEDARCQP